MEHIKSGKMDKKGTVGKSNESYIRQQGSSLVLNHSNDKLSP